MRPPDDQAFLCVLKGLAWKILGAVLKVRQLVGRRHTEHVRHNGMAVTITVCPADQEESVPIPGRFFSDLGQLVWNAIQPGEYLAGKQVGKKIGRDYETDAKLKYQLQDLKERGVLDHDHRKGYSRAIAPPESGFNSNADTA